MSPTSSLVSGSNQDSQAASSQTQVSSKPPQSRFAANSAFQRQLSSQALQMGSSKQKAPSATVDQHQSTGSGSVPNHQRIFQRQLTSSQLPIGGGSDSKMRRQLAQGSQVTLGSARNASVGQGGSSNSATDSISNQSQPQQQEKKAKQKRIISRMLSISTIHTTLTESAAASFMKDIQQQHHSQKDQQPQQHQHSDSQTSDSGFISSGSNLNGGASMSTTMAANDQMPGEIRTFNRIGHLI